MRHKFITKCVRFFVFKSRLLCGKIRQLLQNVKTLLQNVTLLQKAWIQAQNREKCGDYRETLSQTVKPCDTW